MAATGKNDKSVTSLEKHILILSRNQQIFINGATGLHFTPPPPDYWEVNFFSSIERLGISLRG